MPHSYYGHDELTAAWVKAKSPEGFGELAIDVTALRDLFDSVCADLDVDGRADVVLMDAEQMFMLAFCIGLKTGREPGADEPPPNAVDLTYIRPGYRPENN